MENVIMMVNNAGDVFKLCISTMNRLNIINMKYNAHIYC